MQGKNWKTKHSNTIHLYILCVVLPRNIPCFCSLLLLSFSLHLSPVNVSRLHFYCSRSAIYSRANWITMRFSSKPPPLIFLALKPLSKPCVCIRHKRTTRQQQQKTTHNIDCQIMATFSQVLLKYHVGELSSLSICHQIKFAIMLQMWCDEQCVVGVFGVALLYFRNPSASLHTFFVTHFSWASALLTIKLQNSY